MNSPIWIPASLAGPVAQRQRLVAARRRRRPGAGKRRISQSGQAYLAAGGLGILIGDGRLLHADNENVLEGFYNFSLGSGYSATADYQLIVNPAYNRDRGPISVLGVRLHGEF